MKPSVLVDSSLWIAVWRRGGSGVAPAIEAHVHGAEIVFSRFVELELLSGALDEREWRTITDFLAGQTFVESTDDLSTRAARIYFDLRRRGVTIRSVNDCCLAQQALDHDLLLLHRDRDFQAIAEVRPLRQQFLDL